MTSPDPQAIHAAALQLEQVMLNDYSTENTPRWSEERGEYIDDDFPDSDASSASEAQLNEFLIENRAVLKGHTHWRSYFRSFDRERGVGL